MLIAVRFSARPQYAPADVSARWLLFFASSHLWCCLFLCFYLEALYFLLAVYARTPTMTCCSCWFVINVHCCLGVVLVLLLIMTVPVIITITMFPVVSESRASTVLYAALDCSFWKHIWDAFSFRLLLLIYIYGTFFSTAASAAVVCQ